MAVEMVTALLLTILAFADPFWAEKPPREWTDLQIADLLNDSPWAKHVQGPGRLGNLPELHVRLATAGPVRLAEEELARRREIRRPPNQEPPPYDPFAAEYRLWLEEFGPTQIILAIEVANTEIYSNTAEIAMLEEESVMHVRGRRISMTGYFPPTIADPYLRIAFPREISLQDKEVRFQLYIPGMPAPYRDVAFELGPMVVEGKLEL